jgi:molybdopterin-binding protein
MLLVVILLPSSLTTTTATTREAGVVVDRAVASARNVFQGDVNKAAIDETVVSVVVVDIIASLLGERITAVIMSVDETNNNCDFFGILVLAANDLEHKFDENK